jgi:hypothetical protein
MQIDVGEYHPRDQNESNELGAAALSELTAQKPNE